MTVPSLRAYMDHVMTWWPITHVLVIMALQEETVRWTLMTVKVLTVTMGLVRMEPLDTHVPVSLVMSATTAKKVTIVFHM